MTPSTFLDLDRREDKPRERGLTHVMDKGLTLSQIDGLFETAGPYVDIVKLGWGTSYVTANLAEKLARYRAHEVELVCGGTLLEVAELRGKLDAYRAWLSDAGFTCVEVSDGTIDMARERKLEIIELFARDFRVLSEVGSKADDADEAGIPAEQWAAWIKEERAAGAWKVITEARESGTAGTFGKKSGTGAGLIDEIAQEVPLVDLLFEAPQKAQQAWFIRHFGRDVNLGNVPPEEVISLETLRLGLRSDTLVDLLVSETPV
jgi:phosphosulfolactate synthase